MGERALRIAMVAPPWLPAPPSGYGGTELVVAELVDGLLEAGHEVVLFGAPGSRGGFAHACECVSVLPSAWPPNDRTEARYARRVFAQLAGANFDLVHAHVPSAAAHGDALAPPLVLTVHHEQQRGYSALYAAAPEVHYAFISGRQRELEVPVPRSAVVHHGVSPERYRPGPGQGGYVAFLGRFSACKGLHHAIDATRRAGVALRVAGRPHPPDVGYFEAELAHRLREPHVQQLGEADHARKLELLSGARALLFPVDWEEPFGLVMIESMLCGTPVIAFPHGAAPEVVEDGVTGFLVDTPAELSAALRHLERHGFDRARCRARAEERFGARAMVRRYLALYVRALRARSAEEVSQSHA